MECRKSTVLEFPLSHKLWTLLRSGVWFGGVGVGSKDLLTTESVESASLALERVDHVHGSDGLPLGVLRVGNSIPDNVLQEHLENASGLFVDESGDSLDTATASKTTDGGLRDALDVITENLSVTLGASLSKTLSSLAAASHSGGVVGE